MSLFICSLNSGSNGNAYYVGNKNEAVLVDVGISCRELEKRLLRANLSVRKIKAIFISHEHSDHIKGVQVLSRKYSLPVYITHSTLKAGGLQIEQSLIREFTAHEPITIGGLSVTAFPKLHDASDPHSFMVSGNGMNIGVFTDIGSVCHHVIKHFKQCHAAFLESNYHEPMLEEGNYPYFLKQRIRGGHGHLSNHQALDLFTKYKAPFLSHVLLSHLSKDNNSPQLAQKLFAEKANGTHVVVASRDYETEVFRIDGNSVQENVSSPLNALKDSKLGEQITLF